MANLNASYWKIGGFGYRERTRQILFTLYCAAAKRGLVNYRNTNVTPIACSQLKLSLLLEAKRRPRFVYSRNENAMRGTSVFSNKHEME